MEGSWFCPRNDSGRPYSLSQSSAWKILFGCEGILEMFYDDFHTGDDIAVIQYESVRKDLSDLYVWFEDNCQYDGWREDYFDPLERFWDRPD